MDANKSVFISYRRDTSSFIARAVFMDLRQHDYDVFMDVESIDSGAFASVILNQIAARAHFVLILTPGSLERCSEPDDWLRREIETAIDLKRNIVPLFVNNFNLKDHGSRLTGKLSGLTHINALNLPHDYFDAAMERLRTRFLKLPVAGDLSPTPAEQVDTVKNKIAEIVSQSAPSTDELEAERLFAQADIKRRVGDYDQALETYEAVIRLNPQFSAAYYHRGLIHAKRSNYDAAVSDYTRALELNPKYHAVYSSRAFALLELGDVDGAIRDRDSALRLDTDQTAKSYLTQGTYYYESKEFDKAISYYDKALELKPNLKPGYMLRGSAHYRLGNFENAVADYSRVIELDDSGDASAFNNRGEAFFALGDYKQALADFKRVNTLKPGYDFALAGLAITYFALNEIDDARRLWKLLLGSEARYKNVEWIQEELRWAKPLVDAAQKLIKLL